MSRILHQKSNPLYQVGELLLAVSTSFLAARCTYTSSCVDQVMLSQATRCNFHTQPEHPTERTTLLYVCKAFANHLGTYSYSASDQ